MTRVTQAEFARLVDVNRSTVLRAIQRARIAANEDGSLDLEVEDDSRDSLELAALSLWENSGSSRPHHRARMIQIREEKEARRAMQAAAMIADQTGEVTEAAASLKEKVESLNLRLKQAETEKREHEADKARMERDVMAKNLLQREAVEFGMRDFTQRIAFMFDSTPDQLAAEVHALQTPEEVRAHIAEYIDRMRRELAQYMTTAMRLAMEEEQ